MSPDPISSNNSEKIPLGSNFNSSTPLRSFPDLKPLDPSSPWYQFFQKLFPNAKPEDLATYSAAFEKNMFEMLRQQIEKERKKEHEESQKRKRLLIGDD